MIVKTFIETQPGLVLAWRKRIEDKVWLTIVSYMDQRAAFHTTRFDAGIFGSSMAPLWLTF